MTRGLFITVEGLEGAGKSTGIEAITLELDRRNIPFVSTREPGGTLLGERVRDMLLAKSDVPMAAMTELLLMFAARCEHVEKVVEPALVAGRWVICDRFTDSSFAYQGGGRGIPADQITTLERLSIAGAIPDHTFILDVPVVEGLRRAGKTGELDRFESEEVAFFERARAVFLARAETSSRYHVIDAAARIDVVQEEVTKLLCGLIGTLEGIDS